LYHFWQYRAYFSVRYCLKVRKEGTKNYYYFDPEMEAFEQLVSTLQLAMKISKKLPDRSCE
ncbi:hypothetical protein JXX05_16115, partial [Ruthenibacterium lactatiformans]|nr:hypothetical protein [Ruthenibacterium lactatiformans]